jgi:hypothetical protein
LKLIVKKVPIPADKGSGRTCSGRTEVLEDERANWNYLLPFLDTGKGNFFSQEVVNEQYFYEFTQPDVHF